MATKRFCRSVSLLLLQLLLCWSALTIDETATSASQGEESDYRVFHRDQILYPTKAEDKSNAVDDQKVLRQLAAIYASSIRPAERQSHYSSLGISRSTLTETTLFAKPSILFVGPWSTGKTTTINYLLGDHKNDRLLRGVEPTTSHFTAINYGERAGQTDGLILAADPEHPLTQLEQFGQRALQHVTELQLPHRLLANLTLVDTPGMFENQAQRERGYSYDAMLGWFAHRADLIVVMFDPARVEVGHEMSRLFRRVSARHPSVRIVLNKADSIDEEQLMRIYGALLWSLSPLVNASEPPRVYLSSLWSRPHQGQPAFKRLLQRDEQALLTDIRLTIEDGVRNKIALVRRQAQRVRMHYIMVDAIVQTYRRYKGADEQQNSRLLADMIANPTKYGILKAAMERANGVYEEPDANEYTAYFKTISIDDHHTTDELCANDSHCHFLQLQDAIDVRLTDLIRGYGASRKVAVDSDNDEPTDGENADENDNDEAAEALSSNVEAVAEVPDQPADTDEQEEEQEETGDHSHEEQLGDDDDDEDTSSELNENHGNKTEDESSAEMHDYTPPTPSDYVAEASGPFLFAGAAASNPPDRKKKRHEEKTEEVEEIAADDDENEEPNKIKCHYRKSCYETGKVPELGHDIFVAPVSVKAKQKSEESDKEDDDEELSEQKKKLSCKYRKSCYDTGVLPDLNKESEAAVARNQAEKEAAALINHYTTPELRCRYRKSCYETGVVPQLKPQIVVPRSSKAPEDKKDDEETEDDDDEENIKLRCKYRKSCYDTGVLPDLNKESEAAVARKQAEKEAAALINHYTTPELRCRYRKSCYETGQLPEQFKAAPQPAKAEKEHHHRTHKHDTNPKEKHDKPSAPKAARRSDSERSTARTKHHKTHRTVQPKDKKLEERRKQKRSAAKEPELVEVATLPADVMKLQCRYRYSCYRTGVLVLNAPTAEKEHVDASATDEHDEEPDEEPSEDEIKLRCKYRKSCYASHGLEVKLDEHKEAVEEEDVDVEEMQKARLQLIAKWILHTLKEEEAEAQERPKPVDVHTPLTEANEKLDAKIRCHYRKSCYETGVVPQLEPQIVFTRSSKASEDKKDDEETEDDDDDDEDNIKLRCKYRKSCYDTGVLPDLNKENEEAVARKEAEEEAAALVNRYTTPELRCRYRKSCYETGQLPEQFYAASEPQDEEEESLTERIFTEAIPTTIDEVKLFCRYRKSCYQRAAELQSLRPEEEPATKAPHKKTTPSHDEDDDEDEDGSVELKPCKPYQRKNCIKVETVDDTKSTVDEDAVEPEQEVEDLKPCKPYQHKNCIKVDEEEDQKEEEKEEEKAESDAESDESHEELELKPCKPYQRKNCIKVDEEADKDEPETKPKKPESAEPTKLQPCKPYQRKNCIKVDEEDERVEVRSKPPAAKEVEKDDSSEEDADDDNDDEQQPPIDTAVDQKESEERESEEEKDEQEDEDNSKETDHQVDVDDSAEKEEDRKEEAEEEEIVVVPVPIVVPSPLRSEKKKTKESAPEEKPIAKPVASESVTQSHSDKKEKEEDIDTERADVQEKLACKYRISCYEKAGIDYKRTERQTYAATKSDSDDGAKQKAHNVLEDLDDDDEEDDNKLIIKLRCHYRKSCYETGIVPDLTPPEPVLKSNQELIVETGDPTVELKCKYRKSCYESGHLPAPTPTPNPTKIDFTAAPPTADFAPAIRPVTRNGMKLFCRYRKSCYEKFGLDDDDDDEEEADKKKPVPSPPHPAASPKEARREAAAPKAATDNIGATTKPSGKSPQQAAVQPTPEQKTVSRQATKNAAHLAVAVDGSKCHKYRISCREQLGLPPKEKVPIGPNGKKLCRKKPKSS